MAVKLRLVRMGKKKQPTYRVVAADSRSPRDGRFLEIVGTYAPRGASTAEPDAVIKIDNEKAVKWLVNGAQPTERNDVSLLDGSRRSRIARGSGTTVPEVNTLLKQFKEMQKMMKGMASGNMPNIPGMGSMPGMGGMGGLGGRAGRKLAAQAAAGGGPDFDMLSQLMGDNGELSGDNPLFPGLPAPSAPRPVVSGNKGTKKKKKGGRVTPPKSR